MHGEARNEWAHGVYRTHYKHARYNIGLRFGTGTHEVIVSMILTMHMLPMMHVCQDFEHSMMRQLGLEEEVIHHLPRSCHFHFHASWSR